VTNLYPAKIQKYAADPDDDTFNAETKLKIWFELINSLPPEASIQITYPSELSLPNGKDTKCVVIASNTPSHD